MDFNKIQTSGKPHDNGQQCLQPSISHWYQQPYPSLLMPVPDDYLPQQLWVLKKTMKKRLKALVFISMLS